MKNTGWYSLPQLLKAIIPTLYGSFRSCSVVFPSSIRGFSSLEGLMYLFPLGRKTPTISKSEKCGFLSVLRILAKSIPKSSVSPAINSLKNLSWWHGCLGVAICYWLQLATLTDSLMLGCVFCQSEKLQIIPANRLMVQFETACPRSLNSLHSTCLFLAVLSKLLKSGMLIPYVVFR